MILFVRTLDIDLLEEGVAGTDGETGGYAIEYAAAIQVKLAAAPDCKAKHAEQTGEQQVQGNRRGRCFFFHDFQLEFSKHGMVTQTAKEVWARNERDTTSGR